MDNLAVEITDGTERVGSEEPLVNQTTNEDRAIILEEMVRDVLDTRPGILAAKPRPQTPPEPSSLTRRMTMPDRIRKGSSKGHRKSSSIHGLGKDLQSMDFLSHTRQQKAVPITVNDDLQVTRIKIQDIEDEQTRDGEVLMESVTSFRRGDSLRKSSAHLRARLIKHRQETANRLEEVRTVKASCWGEFRYVKWPKFKSRLQVYLSYQLWKSHLKEVEGHFGTAVVSYFIFLRWLFIMNVVIFALWFSIICIPQFVYHSQQSINSTSTLACVFPLPNTENYTCPEFSGENLLAMSEIYSVEDECNGEDEVFSIETCAFNSRGVAESESGRNVLVSTRLYDTECDELDSDDFDFAPNSTILYTVCVGIDPDYEWYDYIIDFVSGTGVFNETSLFQGIYTNNAIGRFDFALAFIFMTGLIYALSIFLLVYKMGHAFNESYVEFRKRRVNYCNKLFTAWDFNITEPKTVKLRQAHIKTELQEELLDSRARETKRTIKQLVVVILIRIFTNVFVLLSLVGAGAAIYYSALFELEIVTSGISVPIIGEYISAIVITLLNAIYPFVLEFIAKLEKYKTASGAVKITLLRTVLVRLASLIVLLASLYEVISSCTRPEEDPDDESVCTFAVVTDSIFSNNTNTTVTCPACWETFIGQQFFKLALINLVVLVGSTILIESVRNLLSFLVVKIQYKKIGERLSKFIKKGTFNIPKSILDLIYTQSLLWLGFLFSPLLPAIVLFTSFFLFYAKKYSLIFNLEPDKKGFERSARTNFIFLLLMLLALFAAAIPVLYAITQLRPSTSCGPFRGQNTMYESITNLIDSWSCQAQIAIDFFGSASFVVPLILFLLLVLYAMYVILKAREARFQRVKKQLVLEGANVSHIVGHLDIVLQQLADQRVNKNKNRTSPLLLEELIKRRSQQIHELPSRETTVTTTAL